MLIALALIACTGEPAIPIEEPAGDAIALVHAPLSQLDIPDDNRGGAGPAKELPLRGPWKMVGTTAQGGYRHQMNTPFRSRAMFFMKAQKGMAMRNAMGRTLPYRRRGPANTPYWNYSADHVTVVTNDASPPEGFVFSYPKAAERELALNFAQSREAGGPLSKQEFAVGAQVQEGFVSHTGLLLPAPGSASWKITLPQSPVLTMTPGLVRPEYADLPAGDGCTLTVEVEDGTGVHEVYAKALAPGPFALSDVDLSRWAEQEIVLRMRTDPGENPIFDYCFVGDPRIHPKRQNPKRIVMVFVDTLRPDHLSMNGYSRDTTPNLDAFAENATVFENARSVAPWTLPSTRSVVTGRQPEFYGRSPTLQSLLTREGYATGMIAGNVYLSTNFEMGLDWGHHEVGVFPPANEVTDRALEWLDQHPGQDSLLMVHYMSAHLPYLEPATHRNRYAGDAPAALKKSDFNLGDVRRARLDSEGRQYIVDRYDNCIHWIDEELQRLLSQIDDNDTLVFFSDHGEEFWEHGGYEHGHTLYDELLRVPLMIKAPGLAAGRVAEPTSLLDITPTVLALAGVEAPEMDGTSLVAAANGDSTARQALAERPQAFGRPLYGLERWGVLDGTKKWSMHTSKEVVYDLATDPEEKKNLARQPGMLEPLRDKLGTSLGSEVPVGFRFVNLKGSAKLAALRIKVHLPGGIRAAWLGQDPLNRSQLSLERHDDNTVTLSWPRGSFAREAYIIPVQPIEEAAKTLEVTLSQSGVVREIDIPDDLTLPARLYQRIKTEKIGRGNLEIGWSVAPLPLRGGRDLSATSDEQSDWLIELGYKDKDKEPAKP